MSYQPLERINGVAVSMKDLGGRYKIEEGSSGCKIYYKVLKLFWMEMDFTSVIVGGEYINLTLESAIRLCREHHYQTVIRKKKPKTYYLDL